MVRADNQLLEGAGRHRPTGSTSEATATPGPESWRMAVRLQGVAGVPAPRLPMAAPQTSAPQATAKASQAAADMVSAAAASAAASTSEKAKATDGENRQK